MTPQEGDTLLRAREFVVAGFTGLVMGLVGAASASALTIDDFDAGSLVFVPASSTSEVQVPGAMLGGERDETVTNTGASGGIGAGAAGGDYSYGAINASGSALLTWDGPDASSALDPTGLGGIDLTEGGIRDGFSIEILSNDLVAPLVLTVYSTATDFSQITVSTPGGIPSGPSTALGIAFSDLIPTGAGADFTNVGALTLEIDGSSQPQLDLTIGSITTTPVPQPTTIAQLGLGLGLLSWLRRHYRSAT